MNEGTELQVLLVGSAARQYSEAATLLRNAGYVLLKCTTGQVAERLRSFRADAVVVDAEMTETLQFLRSLPAAIDPANVLVVCGAPAALTRTRPGVSSISPANLSESLIQTLDVILVRRMFTEPALLDYAIAAGAQFQVAV